MSEVSAPWLHATLADAAESLAAALEKLEAHTDEETASELLRRDLVEVYAKLNYAVNTAYLGSEALNVLTEDELVAWPAEMPFATKSSTPPKKKKSKKRLTPTFKPDALAIGRACMGTLKSEPPGFFV